MIIKRNILVTNVFIIIVYTYILGIPWSDLIFKKIFIKIKIVITLNLSNFSRWINIWFKFIKCCFARICGLFNRLATSYFYIFVSSTRISGLFNGLITLYFSKFVVDCLITTSCFIFCIRYKTPYFLIEFSSLFGLRHSLCIYLFDIYV